jgi:hypothetical protein
MTAEEELLSGLQRLGDGELEDAELDRRVTRFQTTLRRLRDDPVEATRIDALVTAAELGQADTEVANSDRQHAWVNVGLASGNLSSEQAVTARALAGLGSSRQRTSAQIMGELLTGDPEAASLLAEASHRRVLAGLSAATARQAFSMAHGARLHYEVLRHRLDPRVRRNVGFGAGLVVLALLGAGMTMLNLIELGSLLGASGSVLSAMAATGMWVSGAWLAAVASRERHWPLVITGVAVAVMLSLLLVSLHGSGAGLGRPVSRESVLFGVLGGVALFVLVVSAAVLMAHMETWSLFAARWRWHRAQAAYENAAKIEQDDAGAAEVAAEAWLGLVRSRVAELESVDEYVVQATVALATGLLEQRQPDGVGG